MIPKPTLIVSAKNNYHLISKSRQNQPIRHKSLSTPHHVVNISKISPPLVSRAGYKLLSAAQFFQYDFRGKTVLDIGASTGGFTDIALRFGATMVVAIEKGTRQIHPTLLSHPQLHLFEKTDFLVANRKLIIATVCAKENCTNGHTKMCTGANGDLNCHFDTIMADVSFISLTKILKCAIMEGWADENTDFLVMFKPQFELPPEKLTGGVVKNAKIRTSAIKAFEAWLKANNFLIKGKKDNALSGKNGNIERFYWLQIVR